MTRRALLTIEAAEDPEPEAGAAEDLAEEAAEDLAEEAAEDLAEEAAEEVLAEPELGELQISLGGGSLVPLQ